VTRVRVTEKNAAQPFLDIEIRRPSVLPSFALPLSTKLSLGYFRFAQPALPDLGGELLGTDGQVFGISPVLSGGCR
jgi:hypothetical protein